LSPASALASSFFSAAAPPFLLAGLPLDFGFSALSADLGGAGSAFLLAGLPLDFGFSALLSLSFGASALGAALDAGLPDDLGLVVPLDAEPDPEEEDLSGSWP
jgi:hypothetical protein